MRFWCRLPRPLLSMQKLPCSVPHELHSFDSRGKFAQWRGAKLVATDKLARPTSSHKFAANIVGSLISTVLVGDSGYNLHCRLDWLVLVLMTAVKLSMRRRQLQCAAIPFPDVAINQSGSPAELMCSVRHCCADTSVCRLNIQARLQQLGLEHHKKHTSARVAVLPLCGRSPTETLAE